MPGNAHAESYLAAHPERTRRVLDPHDAVDFAHHSFATLLHTGDQDAVSPGDGEGSAAIISTETPHKACLRRFALRRRRGTVTTAILRTTVDG